MYRLKASLIFLVVPFLILSCASTKQMEKKPPFNFEGTTLSKGIDDTETIGVPLEPTTTFNTEDGEAIALVKLENLSGKHTLRWDWYDPKGNLYYSTGDFPLETSRGKYLREATAWHRLSIQGDPAAGYPGDWEVKIFLDDKLKQRKLFVLKAIDRTKLRNDIKVEIYPDDWGLIIGIEDYARLPSVDYARKDALIMKDYFIRVLGVKEENVISLIDGDATKARLEGYLKEYLPSNIGKDTTLYVYFAGHGAPDIEEGDPYLIPHDGDTKFIEQTGYRLTSFYQDLNNLGTQRVYVFLDSCFSGVAARAAEMLIKGARPALVHVKEVRLQSAAVISLSASSAGQMSNIYPATKHGLFTYFLLRALKGEADADDDSWISVREIFEYVKSHVTRVSRKMGAEQIPVIMPSLDILKDVSVTRVVR